MMWNSEAFEHCICRGKRNMWKLWGESQIVLKEKRERGEEGKEREGRKEEMERGTESIRKSFSFIMKVYVKQEYIISN